MYKPKLNQSPSGIGSTLNGRGESVRLKQLSVFWWSVNRSAELTAEAPFSDHPKKVAWWGITVRLRRWGCQQRYLLDFNYDIYWNSNKKSRPLPSPRSICCYAFDWSNCHSRLTLSKRRFFHPSMWSSRNGKNHLGNAPGQLFSQTCDADLWRWWLYQFRFNW